MNTQEPNHDKKVRVGKFEFKDLLVEYQTIELLRDLEPQCTDYFLEHYLIPLTTANTLLPLRNRLTLRMVRWLVQVYAKKQDWILNQLTWKKDSQFEYVKDLQEDFSVHNSYRAKVKSFQPYQCILYYSLGNKYSTTVGQLQYILWAAQNCILDYARENIFGIRQCMYHHNKTRTPEPRLERKLVNRHKKIAKNKKPTCQVFISSHIFQLS